MNTANIKKYLPLVAILSAIFLASFFIVRHEEARRLFEKTNQAESKQEIKVDIPEPIPSFDGEIPPMGYFPDKEGTKKFLESLDKPYLKDAGPNLFQVTGPELDDVFLYRSLYKQFKAKYGRDFIVEKQMIGDCFVKDTLVTMSNGEKRPIQDVKIGEYVISHNGNVRKVVDTFVKKYTGDIVTINTKGYNTPITATEDHRFISYSNNKEEWKPIGDLKIGDKVLITKPNYAENLSDKDKEWLNGLFLAEGSLCKYKNGIANRVTFNLGRHEDNLIEKTCSIFDKVYNKRLIVSNLPSKPSVSLLRCSSVDISKDFQEYCNGNTYSKRVNINSFTKDINSRISLLNGWLSGDGHIDIKRNKCVGVSVSKDMIKDFFDISMSCGIKSNINLRKARKQSKESAQLCFYNDSYKVFPDRFNFKPQPKYVVENGLSLPIDNIKRESVENIDVYCITVEKDHSFVANGYGVHNCVSWGYAHGVAVHLAVLCDLNKSSEFWFPSTEAIYGGSRVEARGLSGNGTSPVGGYSDGSYGAAASKFLSKWGVVYRDKYDFADLTKYSGSRAKEWGAYGNGGKGDNGKADELAKKFPIKSIAMVRTYEEAVAAIKSGYPVPICSGQGFTSTRDSIGFAKPSGSWAHCFPPETIINTYPTPKKIKDIKVGDNVITHTGKIRPVTETMVNPYEGNVINISVTGCLDITATEEHPILIYRPYKNQACYAPGIDLETYSNGSFKYAKKQKEEHEKTQPRWVEAKYISEGDYVLVPRYIERKEAIIPIWEERECKMPNPLYQDKDIAFLFGYYIADGSMVKSHKISLVLPANSPDKQRLIEGAKKLGFEARFKDFGTYERMYVYSAVLADTFAKWFGASSETKQIPEFLLTKGWDLNSLLEGYCAGDGTDIVKNGEIVSKRITTVSEKLAYQTWLLCVHLNKYPKMTKCSLGKVENGAYPNGKQAYAIEYNDNPKRLSTRYFNDYYCMPVREVSSRPYNGNVYNIEVDTDHSYLANGITVHNCMVFIAARKTDKEGLLCLNSWGPNWISGPKWPSDQPDGSFWVDKQTANRILAQEDSFAISGLEGFPFNDLNNGDWVNLNPKGNLENSEPVFVLAP